MGVKHSKRSVNIMETSTKGEIEGFGNEGKVEKIVDGVMEKTAVNGHVENDLQNGEESPHQNNSLEVVQNGEAAAVAEEKASLKNVEESAAEETVNGQLEVNGEGEKLDEEEKKSDEKKDKKKKEKLVKKKFSFRNFSFSKKDKSKPKKEEKSPEKVDEGAAEEGATDEAENVESIKSPTEENVVEVSQTADAAEKTISPVVPTQLFDAVQEQTNLDDLSSAQEKAAEVVVAVGKTASDDLPPPLPASPPPSEPVGFPAAADAEDTARSPGGIADTFTGKLDEVTSSSFSDTLTKTLNSTEEILTDAHQMAIETGKQIEEKATSLLKAVEKRAEDGLRTAGGIVEDGAESIESLSELGGKAAAEGERIFQGEEAAAACMEGEKLEEEEGGKPVSPAVDVDTTTDLEEITTKLEDTADKSEESGAGESLADIPKDLADEMVEEEAAAAATAAAAAAAAATTGILESSEVSKTIAPPPLEPVAATGQ